MDFPGEEKRIRALFSEQKLEDVRLAPSFGRVWNRAQLQTIRPRRAFNLSFIAATALLVCALASLAIWSQYSRQRDPARALAMVGPAVLPTPADKAVVPASSSGPDQMPKRRVVTRGRTLKLTAAPQTTLSATNQKTIQAAKEIGSWSSPTATLLSSPSSEVMNSLPQLNENANELKSFLPSRPR
jgi:hypothetical protein